MLKRKNLVLLGGVHRKLLYVDPPLVMVGENRGTSQNVTVIDAKSNILTDNVHQILPRGFPSMLA